MSKLDNLKAVTTVVADTGEFSHIARLKPIDATTNPSLLLKVAKSGECHELILSAIELAKKEQSEQVNQRAAEILAVLVGCEIAKLVPGRVSTEVDARLSFNTEKTVASAQRIIALYKENGVGTDRVLIKIAATWEGVRAAEILEKQGIQCNLTLIFNQAQARACAEAGVYLISPFVGRIYDYFKALNPDSITSAENDPGVLSVRGIYDYFRQHNYKTIVMGASFRSVEQVLALAGCDRLTISPGLLDELAEMEGEVEAKLNSEFAVNPPAVEQLTEQQFRWDLCTDAMANTKLAEGITQFAKDQEALESLLGSYS